MCVGTVDASRSVNGLILPLCRIIAHISNAWRRSSGYFCSLIDVIFSLECQNFYSFNMVRRIEAIVISSRAHLSHLSVEKPFITHYWPAYEILYAKYFFFGKLFFIKLNCLVYCK